MDDCQTKASCLCVLCAHFEAQCTLANTPGPILAVEHCGDAILPSETTYAGKREQKRIVSGRGGRSRTRISACNTCLGRYGVELSQASREVTAHACRRCA